MTSAVVILQARMASTRLPGKALAPLGAHSLLGHCLARLWLADVGPVLLATTTKPEDDELVRVAALYDVPSFRGPSSDVLTRFALAAQSAGADLVIRATGDNPAVDIQAPLRTLSSLRSSRVDHVVERNLPYGAAVEALTAEALFRAAAVATKDEDREHVTPLIRRDSTSFTSMVIDAPRPLQRSDIRLTVDTPEDLAFMQQVALRLDGWDLEPSLNEIIEAVDVDAARARCA